MSKTPLNPLTRSHSQNLDRWSSGGSPAGLHLVGHPRAYQLHQNNPCTYTGEPWNRDCRRDGCCTLCCLNSVRKEGWVVNVFKYKLKMGKYDLLKAFVWLAVNLFDTRLFTWVSPNLAKMFASLPFRYSRLVFSVCKFHLYLGMCVIPCVKFRNMLECKSKTSVSPQILVGRNDSSTNLTSSIRESPPNHKACIQGRFHQPITNTRKFLKIVC